MGLIDYIRRTKDNFQATRRADKIAVLKAETAKLKEQKVKVDEVNKLQREHDQLKTHIQKNTPKSSVSKFLGGMKTAINEHKNQVAKDNNNPWRSNGPSSNPFTSQNMKSPFAIKRK
jgi:hypothetical protein